MMTLTAINTIAGSVPARLLPEIFDLDEPTGRLVWKKRPVEHFEGGKPTPEKRAAMWNGKYAGKAALITRDPRGYLFGAVRGKNVYAHRVIRALLDGEWPAGEIDHINRDKTDNRPENLRVVTHSENRLNCADCDLAAARRPPKKPVPSRISGVRRQGANTWSARIKVNGIEKHLGSFPCFGLAVLARRRASA